MNTNKKILIIVALMLISLAAATIINIGLNFRDYALKNSIEKSKLIAKVVRDGLTSHMVNGIMDKRADFIKNLSNVKDIEDLWIVRSDAVRKQYGQGFKNEVLRDTIDKEVIKTGKMVQKFVEEANGAHLRVTVPFIASSYDTPDCTSCHNVAEGTVLGAVSMELDISSVREAGAYTILRIFLLNLVFIIIALGVTRYYIKPYMGLFEDLLTMIKKAHTGDFTHKINSNIKGDGALVVEQINNLFQKMQETFGELKNNLNTFVSRANLSCSDPLYEAKAIIHELADVYKFKHTIELDPSRSALYNRLVYVISHKFEIEHFALYEVDKVTNTRVLLYISEGESFCDESTIHDTNRCRTQRTNSDVISTDFPNLCENCTKQDMKYICINFNINEDVSLNLSISAKTEDKINDINQNISSIRNYFEAAKPVIESRILMDKLKDSSLRDGMTGLYNRRFLEEYIDSTMVQAVKSNIRYSVLMIDIDFFKMVNDTHGHDVGDIIIKGLSETLISNIREIDMAIRYGGEEFIILLHNPSVKKALEIAEKIRASFQARSFSINSHESISKTISIGVAHLPEDADSIWKVIKFADTALYVAKDSGRNKVIEFKKEMFDLGESY